MVFLKCECIIYIFDIDWKSHPVTSLYLKIYIKFLFRYSVIYEEIEKYIFSFITNGKPILWVKFIQIEPVIQNDFIFSREWNHFAILRIFRYANSTKAIHLVSKLRSNCNFYHLSTCQKKRNEKKQIFGNAYMWKIMSVECENVPWN